MKVKKVKKCSLSTTMLSLWFIIVSTMINSALAQNHSLETLISEGNCPSPFIVKQKTFPDSPTQFCLNDCCLPCPFLDNFYEEGKIKKTFEDFAVVGIISFFLMMILAVCFVTLPSHKKNPLAKKVLFPLAVSVMFFEGSEFFTLNQQKTQCVNPITPADPKSNVFCAIQAFFTLGGAYAIACWSALLMTHLHLTSVWRIEFITRKIIFFHILISGVSISAYVIPMATRKIQSTNICFISPDMASLYFYFLSFIYVAFAAHLTTFIYMAHVTFKSNRAYPTLYAPKRISIIEAQRKVTNIKAVFMMQWRALLGALLMLLIYIANWHFYVIETRGGSISTSPWVVEWLECLQKEKGQTICANQISGRITRYEYIFALLFLNRTAGILIFLIFAAKKSFILEVFEVLSGVKRSPDGNTSYFDDETDRFSEFRASLSRKFSISWKSNGENDTSTLTRQSMRKSSVPSTFTFTSKTGGNHSRTSTTYSNRDSIVTFQNNTSLKDLSRSNSRIVKPSPIFPGYENVNIDDIEKITEKNEENLEEVISDNIPTENENEKKEKTNVDDNERISKS